MANPLQQQTRLRKMYYFGAIVVLFTISLIHREFVVKPQAYRLQLREEAKGDVELTSSAVRLLLIGSRGVAVTMLWYNAMDKQKRAEWNEMELIVKSITKLQPYFITPWLYQSWNISFNVAVECDKPRDKYYYISRGIELLGEGERRNRGSEDLAGGGPRKEDDGDARRVIYPGNPEMRHYLGFFYQLKIGGSDERLTMRSLVELSCVDPVERNPDKFLTKDELGREVVDAKTFLAFARKYPRTIRRLRDQLDYSDPKRIVQFLRDHQDIPNRFKTVDRQKLGVVLESELKEPNEQFPLVPPAEERHWPNPRTREFTKESIDVYLMCRTWYEFAQKPLPAPDPNPRPIGQDYDKTRFRIPKQMVTQLFRQYPARAQVYIAEGMEEQGYIDGDGWDVVGAFEKLAPDRLGEEPIGREPKHQSRLAWDKSYEMYKEFGRQNGMYFSPAEMKKLEAKADLAFQPIEKGGLGLKPGELPQAVPPEWRKPEKVEVLDALTKLHYNAYFRRLANFDAFFYQAEGERDPITAAARKALFIAERKRKGGTPSELMLREYDNAWALYTIAALKYPQFAQVSSMQEDLCEAHQRYLESGQRLHSEAFKKRALWGAKIGYSPYTMEAGPVSVHTPELIAGALAFWPPTDWRSALATRAFVHDNFPDDAAALNARLAGWLLTDWREAIVRHHLVTQREKDTQQMHKVVPIPKRLGPLDTLEFYDGPLAKELKEDFLFRWTMGAGLCQSMSVAGTITYPGVEYLMLSRRIPFGQEEHVKNWKPIITGESRRVTMDRLGLNR